MNAIQTALTDLQRNVADVVKAAMQKVPVELSAFTGEFMHGPQKKDGMVVVKRITKTGKSKSTGSRYYNIPNTTNKLRTLYGNLQRAITPRGLGNVSTVTNQGGEFSVLFGFDPTTTIKAGKRSATLIYGEIHENRGKSFLKPGMELFLKDKNGFAAIMRELETDLREQYP